MTSFEEKKRAALAKAQIMSQTQTQGDGEADTAVASGSTTGNEIGKIEGNPLIKISKFSCRPLYSKVDINCDKWLMTMSEDSRIKLERPPSLDDGIDFKTEQELRFLGCELIQEGAILLKLPQTAAATGQILFHRFYYQRSFLKYWFQVTLPVGSAGVCSRREQEEEELQSILKFYSLVDETSAMGWIVRRETTTHLKPADINQKYMNAKTHVLNTEKRMMACLGFVVHVKHPHKLIISYIYVLGMSNRNDFIQQAWSYMNDGLRTDMFVRYKPETIACACIFLAARTIENPIPLPSEPFHWFELFDASDRDVKSIADQLIRLYARPRPVNMNRLVYQIDKMREEKELAEKAKQAAIIAAKFVEINEKEKKEEVEEKFSKKRKSLSRSRSRSRSPRRKYSPKRRRDSPERKKRHSGKNRDRRDDKDRKERERRDNRDEKRKRSRSRDKRNRDRDYYDKKDRTRNETIYDTLKNRQREVPIKPRK